MAKRKTVSAGKTKSASVKKSKAPAAGPAQPPAVNASVKATGPRALTGIEIGHVAGDVWAALGKDGELTLAALKKAVKAPPDLVVAAIGWLAREDKLEFNTSGGTLKIGLRHRG